MSEDGKLRSGTKSDLLDNIPQVTRHVDAISVNVSLHDGSMLLHILKPTSGMKTFRDYATLLFIPFILSELSKVTRLDIIWDRYFPFSLKNTTRQTRGSGDAMRVKLDGPLPKKLGQLSPLQYQ